MWKSEDEEERVTVWGPGRIKWKNECGWEDWGETERGGGGGKEWDRVKSYVCSSVKV